jgi:hypothetical protein
MRGALLSLVAVTALFLGANPAAAQLSVGVHGAAITSIDELTTGTGTVDLANTYGVGGRVVLGAPLFPISLVGAAEYYFTDCGALDCSLWTAEAGVNLGLPLPVVKPYVHAGLQRRTSQDGSVNGFVAGVGVQLNFVVSLFVEGLVEFVDLPTGIPSTTDVSPLVIKAGIIF